MSRVGQTGLARSSTPRTAQRLPRTASAHPEAATAPGESYNGHWAWGWGPGGRPGGRGAAGSPEPSLFARFPSTMAAPLFPRSPPPPRLSPLPPLTASASKQPARRAQATRPLCWGTRRGRARHSHSLTLSLAHTHRHTQRPPLPPVSQSPSLFSLSLPPSHPARSLSEPLSE